MALSPLLGLWLRMPPVGARNEAATEMLADPEVQLSLTGRSGPLVVEIEYRVAQDNARAFHNVMQEVQFSRQRNGAYGWSIARDIADPELWTERYHCPTWLDYLRQRNRATQSERALHQSAIAFHLGPEPIRVRRMLERPFGSVRWKEEYTRPRRQRGAAGGRDRGRQQHVVLHASFPDGNCAARKREPESGNCSAQNSGFASSTHPGMTGPTARGRQRLLAGLAEPRAVLLQAGQHDLIAVIEMRAAKARRIPRAGIMPLLLRAKPPTRSEQAEARKEIWSSSYPFAH